MSSGKPSVKKIFDFYINNNPRFKVDLVWHVTKNLSLDFFCILLEMFLISLLPRKGTWFLIQELELFGEKLFLYMLYIYNKKKNLCSS